MATKDRTSLKNDFANGKYATGEKFADLIDSMKVVQLPVVDPQALGTSLSFIDSISQDEDGKITATKKTLDLANAHELNPFKGWYKTGDTLPTDGFDGAYLYFKDTSELTGQTTIYRWNGTAYADTGTVVDTSNVQTFASGQAVNAVKIKDESGEEVTGNADVLSAEAGKTIGDAVFGGVSFVDLDISSELVTQKLYKIRPTENAIKKDASSASGYTCLRIPCNEGDVFRIYGSCVRPNTNLYTALYVFSDDTEVENSTLGTSYTILSWSQYDIDASDGVEITAPAGSKYLSIVFYDYDSDTYKVQSPTNVTGLENKIKFKNNKTPSDINIVDGFDSDSSTDIPTARTVKVLNDKIDPVADALDVKKYIAFKASLESKLLLSDSIVLANNGDSLEFKVENYQTTDSNSQYSFTSRDSFGLPSIGIRENGLLSVSYKQDGASVYSWMFTRDNEIGDVRNKVVKISYEEDKIKFYVDNVLKKTIDNQGLITIKAFGKTGNYGYVSFDLVLFKVNGVDYDILAHSDSTQTNNVTAQSEVIGLMTNEQETAINNLSRKIIVRKSSSTKFFVDVPLDNGQYATHEFDYLFDTDSQSSQTIYDVWNAHEIYVKSSTGNNYGIQGNLNFIYKLLDVVPGTTTPRPGFEGENLFVGCGHTGEVKVFQKFYADGKEIEPWNLDNPIECSVFRVVLKAVDYAIVAGPHIKLDENDEPIITAIHTYDAIYNIDGTVIMNNNLLIKRDGVRFNQLHGAMLRGWYSGGTDNVLVEDANFTSNDYSFDGLEITVTPVEDSDSLYNGTTQKAMQGVITLDNECQVIQRMTNIKETDNQYTHCSFFNANTADRSMKIYFEPYKTEYNGTNQSDTFNEGDIISVVNYRRITCK